MFPYQPLRLSFDIHPTTKVANVYNSTNAVNVFSPGAVAAASGTVAIWQ